MWHLAFKVANKSTRYVDNPRECENQMRIGSDFLGGEPLQLSWIGYQKSLGCVYTQTDGI